MSSRTSPTPNDAGRRATASRAWRGSRRSTSIRQPVHDGSRASGYERWANGALGYLVLEEIVRATLDQPPDAARAVVAERCFPTGVLGSWVRRLAEGGLVAALTATSPKRLPHPERAGADQDEPPRDRGPVERRRRPRRGRLDGGGDARRKSSGGVPPGRARALRRRQSHKAFALAVGLEPSSAPWPARSPVRCSSSPGPSTTRCPRCARSLREGGYPEADGRRRARPRRAPVRLRRS